MGLLRFSYRSEILSLHTNITVTLPSEELTYYPLTDIKREEGVLCKKKVGIPGRNEIPDGISASWWRDDDTCVVGEIKY